MGDDLKKFARGKKNQLIDPKEMYHYCVQEMWHHQQAVLLTDAGTVDADNKARSLKMTLMNLIQDGDYEVMLEGSVMDGSEAN
jgi:hypothetical protein